MAYKPRIIDNELGAQLKAIGAVVIEGPKASGKTETARRFAHSEVLLDVDQIARESIVLDPKLVLDGETPRLIDEWQLEPVIWNHIRRAIDDRKKPGQFILTGSAVPADDVTRHSGAGRLTRLRLRTMSLFELEKSSGDISLARLLDQQPARSTDVGMTIPDLADEVALGGWPGFRDGDNSQTLRLIRNYLNEISRVDISTATGHHRDPERVERLMRSLARNIATYAASTTIARDTSGADGALKDDTVREYVDALKRIMIVEDQPMWAPHLRSRHSLRSASKRHFVDPSLAVAALKANQETVLRDPKLFGFLFESLVVRDLRVYSQANDANVLQYRDSGGLEVDVIVQAGDGRWAAFEIKLGTSQIDQAAENLKKFAERIDTSVCGEPSTLGVIVGTGYGVRRKDGIDIIPIGALGP